MSPDPNPPESTEPVRYQLDGSVIHDLADFYAEIGRAVNGPGGYFGSNLDALADCLRGGFGTPEDRPFVFEWRESATARARLARADDDVLERIVEVFAHEQVPLELR
ncbi:barstar family protein [Williamsia sp. CHRR-6]|uniref:barstar family protein n=1 Tax=Williamsia sp. CHRR-6 TaxID=2835871 RepID=UPI001BDB6A46|nr:barstar family protein [Williamsia sp. CHRR-6]MBT0567703.1 barstar family protein [Williamsia sp. CHRR-6]